MTFSPHLMNQAGGMMSPVYLPGTSYNAGGRPSGTAHWRNTGEAYDRDGNVSARFKCPPIRTTQPWLTSPFTLSAAPDDASHQPGHDGHLASDARLNIPAAQPSPGTP